MNLFKKYGADCWAIGFVRGGMQTIMERNTYQVDWVEMPKDRWYADPFILDVTDQQVLLLVEDYSYTTKKGIITLLKIDRQTYSIVEHKEILELPTHLSFPNIIRRDGKTYIYPESGQSGKLDVYEYDSATETMQYCTTICNDVVWDSDITELFGEPMMFTAAHNDRQLDIYTWDNHLQRFVSKYIVPSEKKNSRLGGKLFEYNGKIYYPAQDCEGGYGVAIDVKELSYLDGAFSTKLIKKIKSTHPTHTLGLHTLNEYKGIVVIDVHGYRYGRIGGAIAKLIRFKSKLKALRKQWNS